MKVLITPHTVLYISLLQVSTPHGRHPTGVQQLPPATPGGLERNHNWCNDASWIGPTSTTRCKYSARLEPVTQWLKGKSLVDSDDQVYELETWPFIQCLKFTWVMENTSTLAKKNNAELCNTRSVDTGWGASSDHHHIVCTHGIACSSTLPKVPKLLQVIQDRFKCTCNSDASTTRFELDLGVSCATSQPLSHPWVVWVSLGKN